MDVYVAAISFSIEEPLNVRDKRHELAAMPFMELVRVARELVHQHPSGLVRLHRPWEFPVLLDRHGVADRIELQGPTQDLPGVPNNLIGVRSVRIRHTG